MSTTFSLVKNAVLGVLIGIFMLPVALYAYERLVTPCMIDVGDERSFIGRVLNLVSPLAYACGGGSSGGSGGGGQTCPVADLTPMTDPLALQMEGGQTVIWDNTHTDLQPDFNSLRQAIRNSGAGRDAVAASVYRPLQYQNHLWEIKDRWCTALLSDPSSTNSLLCPAVRTNVQTEKNKHFPTQNCPLVVSQASACSSHTRGIAIDISLTGITSSAADALAAGLNLNLRWANITNDPVHWQLTRNLTPCP